MIRVFTATVADDYGKSEMFFQGLPVEEIPLPVSRIAPVDYSREKIDPGSCHWVFFTSANAVEIFFQWHKKDLLDSQCRIAVVGSGTAAAVRSRGGKVAFMPSVYTGRVLAQEFNEKYAGNKFRIIVPRASKVSTDLAALLAGAGHQVHDPVIYQTVLNQEMKFPDFNINADDFVVFKSPSGYRNFINFFRLPEEVTALAIGPVTAEAVKNGGHENVIVASPSSRQGLRKLVETIVLSKEE